jgi:60 kDa SS-A/Ro ribonucleoprotein
MSSFNRVSVPMVMNHNGTAVKDNTNEQKLRRLVLANMLFQDQFYVDGKTSADLIKALVPTVPTKFVEHLAITARSTYKLRHVPLLLLRELARTGQLRAEVLYAVIQRADEMGDFLSLYWSEGKTPISNQVKKGLALAFGKFNEYSLAKYDRNTAAIKIRDIMFLTHVKPQNEAQEALFKRVANKELATPDTWETELSGGADKAETFTRLMSEKKLGALAFLRNLRNMVNAGVPNATITAYGATVDTSKVLPFRYVAAAQIVPQFEPMLEAMMLRSLESHEKMPGKTLLLVDNSGSMYGAKVSAKSDLERFDAAASLAMLCREVCEDVVIYSFSDTHAVVPPRRGFALRDAIKSAVPVRGTYMGNAIKAALADNPDATRIMVFTDDESADPVPSSLGGVKAYMINVASYKNSVDHGAWTTVTGFSESVIDYVMELEKA